MTEPKTINELIENVREKMKNLNYTNSSMASYEKVWKSFKMYAQKKGINLYTTEVGLAFLEKKCKFISRHPIKYTMEEQVRAINRLDEYFKYNMISTKRPNSKKYTFPIPFRELVQSYIDFRRVEGLSESRIKAISNYMEQFTNFLDDVGLKNISELDISHIHRFIQFSNNYTASTVRNAFTCVRRFLSFIYEKSLINSDFSFIIPSIRYCRESTIPSAYSKDEVEKILNSVDRCNPKGKRDYAMMLLAARLGLRSSDILNLTFSNLNWEHNTIELIQEKTKKTIQLPLLNEVGDAIIDYLRVRPNVEIKNVFLRVATPAEKLQSHSLYEIVSKYISRAGIKVPNGKKHGPHALRHSLSSIMLENRVPLPVISEILSHSSSDTTKVYLKIDISQLRECALEVPDIENQDMEV